ncbi:MAG: hypothetical protein K9N06_05270 [Candidatus Cloacimonetes bacterium]|nr:hypothetical protein [Candidatus Cloacimonadota bacterium]
MKYNRNKFDRLPDERKKRTILKFIRDIEQYWDIIQKRQELLLNFREYLIFFEDDKFQKAGEQLETDMNRRDFLKTAVPLEQKLNLDLRDPELSILKHDGLEKNAPALDVILVLDNLRSAFNVGSIIRTAECFGIKELHFCGYTPDNERVSKTAMGTRELVTIKKFTRTEDSIISLQQRQLVVYALETVDNAESIYNCAFQYPAALIVGNEALGISEDIIRLVDKVVQIPLAGWKNSLNVAVATAVTIAEMRRRS